MAVRKRMIDVVAGTVLAVVVTPLVGALAVAVAVSLRAWPFFVQERVGRDGRPFRIVKLRTLPRTTPAYADKYAIREVATTRFCSWLRASHLDELPQLYLVPPGHMSLVGPRPEMANLLGGCDRRFVAARCTVRPGCTGLWQLGPDSGRLIGESPWADLLYLRHASTRLDLWVLWRTARLMLRLGGPVELADAPRWVAGDAVGPVDDARPTRRAPLALAATADEWGPVVDVATGNDVVDLDGPRTRTA